MKQVRSVVQSGQLLEALRSSVPGLTTGRWRPAVLEAFTLSSRRDGLPRDFVDVVRSFRYEPDAFVIGRAERFLHFFEIEVYNPMTDAKVEAYGKFAVDLAAHGVELGILVVNRYGHVNAVDTLPYYRDWLRRHANEVIR